MDIEIQTTADGSATLYRPDIDEHYHSVKGALTEGRHIFVNCALLHHKSPKLKLLEIGFGTGLNAILTALESSKSVEFNTLELFPLSKEIIEKADYSAILPPVAAPLYKAIHAAEWNKMTRISDTFSINKILCDFTAPQTVIPQGMDIVYFDAFAPEKQPEMWSVDVLKKVFDAMNPGGILTTYCAKGEIRRRLQSVGFIMERLPGPPNGKREILRATKPETLAE